MNYQKELINLVSKLDTTPKVLLHSCCGPCSTTCIDFLTKYFDVTVFFYNPNIEPLEEYLKRKEEQIRFIKEYNGVNKIDFLDCDYENEEFKKASCGLEKEKEGQARCAKCFYLRLNKTSLVAKENNYDYFATTLTVSPHKNSKVINEIGLKIEKFNNVKFLVSDFKKNEGYKKSISLSKEYDLYRQDYCGCLYARDNK